MQPAARTPSHPPDLPEPTGSRDNGATAGNRLAQAAGPVNDVPDPEEGSHPMAQTNHPSVPVQPQQSLAGGSTSEPSATFRPRVVPDIDPEQPGLEAASEEFGAEFTKSRA